MRRRLLLLFAVLLLTGATSAGAVGQPASQAMGPPGSPDSTEHPAAPADGVTRMEPAVAVSPLDPRRVVTAANTFGSPTYIGVNTSSDGGRSFREHRMPNAPGASVQSDPNLAFDHTGRLFAAYISYNYTDRVTGGLAVARSDDGGDTWPRRPVVASHHRRLGGTCEFEDFPAIATDPRPGQTRVHIAWQRAVFFGANCATRRSTTIMAAHSADGGRTWSEPIAVATGERTLTYLPTVTVGPDGRVLVTAVGYTPESYTTAGPRCPSSLNPLLSTVATSLDGGRTFAPHVVQRFCSPNTVAPVGDPLYGVTLGSYTGATYGVPPNTNTVVDPRSRRLVNVASGQDGFTGQQRALVAWSRDGAKWSPGGVIPALPGENQQFPRLAVGPTGRLSLLYLAQLPGGLLVASHTTSADDGRTWTPVERLSAMPARSTSLFWLSSLGDYVGNAVGSDGLAHPVWTDPRPQPRKDPVGSAFYGGTIYTKAVRS